MDLVKRVHQRNNMVCVALLKHLWVIAVLDEIVEFTWAFILTSEMLAHNDQRITGKELVFLDAVHFKVDPDSGIGDAIPVEEFRTFDERRLIFESDDVYSQFTDELPESCGFEILLFKKSKITEEDIQGLRDKLFIESFRKHVFHEKVNLIHCRDLEPFVTLNKEDLSW